MLPGKIACPNCHNILRSNREPPLGKKIKCLKCGVPFLVTEEEVRRAEALDAAAQPAAPPAPAPAPAPASAAAVTARPPSKPPEPLPAEAPATPEPGDEFYLGVEEPPKPEPTLAPPVAVAEGPPPTPATPPAAAPAHSGGFVSWLHTALPKPVLFGLYGAVGGLLGVLLLGELFWALLHPTPIVILPVKIAVPPDLTVYTGSHNTLPVKIARVGFEGPVRLEVVGLPGELDISKETLAADQTEVKLHVTATSRAPAGNHLVQLRATAPNGDKVDVTESFRLKVEPAPPMLQVTASPEVTVYAGTANRFGFIVARHLFEGPVRVEVLDLPKGVHVPLVTLPDKVGAGSMDVTVTKDAKIGSTYLEIEAHALANHRISGRAKIQLNIEPPPGKLQLAVSPLVTVYPGDKNKLTVKIARQEFTGAIHVEVRDPPADVKITEFTIPEKSSEAVLDVSAGKASLPGGVAKSHSLRVHARALINEPITASQPFTLQIQPTPPTVQLAASPRVSVYPGGKASFGVKIARQRFQGPVVLSAGPVGYLTATPLTIPADRMEGDMEIAVGTAALAGLSLKQTVPLTVTARSADGRAVTTETVQVDILAPPSDLALKVSPEVEVYQGGKCRFTAKVARSGFVGTVQVSFASVPPGVTLTPAVIPYPATQGFLNGQATLKAEPGKYQMLVTATGPKAPDGKVPTKTETMTLVVKPYDPARRPPLDIVFVLDVTNSMDPQIKGVRDGVQQFVQQLKNKELEARIGLVAFRDITFDAVPFEILKFNGELFTTDTKAYSAEVGKLKAEGGGDEPESSLDAIEKAAGYPFRPGALRILLLITDAPPQTKGNSVQMAKALQILKANKIDQVHLIVRKADLPIYQQLQQVAKGGFFDLNDASKKGAAGGGFTGLLPILGKEIVTTIGAAEAVAKGPPQPEAAAPPPPPPGEKAPAPPAERAPDAPRPEQPQSPKAGVVVPVHVAPPTPPAAGVVDSPLVAAPTLQGVQSNQMFADKDRLRLLIAIALWTAAVAAGIGLALVGGQKRYLRQSWLSLGEAGKAVGAGLLAGLVAGIIGQGFFQATSGTAVWNAVSRVLAWTILGGLIGAGMGFFVPNLPWRRAFVGGCVGGLMGALGFMLLSLYADAMLGRWLGAALLGLFIGLMIGLAEIASRRYWLEVAFGEREVRIVTLGAATVALGGDEKQVSVYVPGAPAKGLGYRVDRNRVFCEDYPAGKTAIVAPGDRRPLANAKVKVCSAASAEGTGANLQVVVVRNLALMEGMPLTAEDIPGLEPQRGDGIVALVSRRPNNPQVFLLRNRSQQPWTVTEAGGAERKIDPGLGIELSSPCQIDFGQVKAKLDPGEGAAKAEQPAESTAVKKLEG